MKFEEKISAADVERAAEDIAAGRATQASAARALGCNRKTLYRRIRALEERERYESEREAQARKDAANARRREKHANPENYDPGRKPEHGTGASGAARPSASRLKLRQAAGQPDVA